MLSKKHTTFLRFLALAPALLALALASCQTQPWRGFPSSYNPELVWPRPPETPRVAWLMEVRKQEDLFDSAGFWRGIGELIAGPPDTAMVNPYAVALHPAGGLLVADTGRKLVHFYDWSRRRYVALGPKLESGLRSPVGVAALKDGRILVCDSALAAVLAFDRDGKPLGRFAAGLQRPAGIAASEERGEVYVADVTAHCVRVFSLGGSPLRVIGAHGAEPGQFNFPTHLALDAQGQLVVTDSMNFRVQILTPEGRFVRAFGKPGQAVGNLSKPKGVAVDSARNTIVVEGLYGALLFFNEKGELLLSLGGTGGGSGEFYLPGGICCDRNAGLIFVADSYNRRVQVFRLLNDSGHSGSTR